MILLSILLFISVVLNILFIWYIKGILQRLFFVSENIGDLLGSLNAFASHLEKIYQMETFYGDSELASLLGHSKEIRDIIRDFEEIYSLTDEKLLDEEESGEEKE